MKNYRLSALIGVVGPLFLPSTSLAASLSNLNYARLGPSTAIVEGYCANPDPTPCNGTAQILSTGWSLTYSSESWASYGNLGARSSAFLSGDGSLGTPSTIALVGANANFRDQVTIDGGVGDGVLFLQYIIDGSSATSVGQAAYPVLQRSVFDMGITHQAVAASQGPATVRIPFTFGLPVDFEVHFYAISYIGRYESGGWANADFISTARLQGLSVSDSNGQPVPAFTLTASSGTDYVALAEVPEPGTLWLVLPIAGVLLWLRRTVTSRCSAPPSRT